PESELFELVARSGARLRAALGVRGSNGGPASRAAQPTDLEAARLYAQALVRRRAYDDIGARPLLEQVVAREPGFAMAHSALAEVYVSLGESERARAAAHQAAGLAAGLTREERLVLEARSHRITGDWDRAIEIYRSLLEFFPDDLEYGLALARVQTLAGRSGDALKTVDKLRRPPRPSGRARRA